MHCHFLALPHEPRGLAIGYADEKVHVTCKVARIHFGDGDKITAAEELWNGVKPLLHLEVPMLDLLVRLAEMHTSHILPVLSFRTGRR